MERQPPEFLRAVKRLISRKNFSETGFIYKYFSRQKHGAGKPRVLIDVGAHYGITMLKFARAGWKVYCFEPDDRNRSELEKTIKANSLQDVTVDARAVSDMTGHAKYYSSDISTGISSLLKFHSSHKETGEVEVTTLASYCSEKGITRIDFLKIDTEGFDLKVIKGLDLNTGRPDIILCEYEDAKTLMTGYSKEDMTGYLESNGYRCIISEWYPVVRYGTRHRWRRLISDIRLTDKNSWGNIIAAQPAAYEALLKMLPGSVFLRKKIFRSGK